MCTRESAFLNILVNCSHHFLKFETLSRQLEIVFRAGKRDVSAKSKVRLAITSFTASIRAVKSNLKSGVEMYCDCMRSTVTDNLASDFVSSKLQLSSVMHELSKLATAMSTRDSSKNSLLSAMEKRLNECSQKPDEEPLVIAKTYCSKSWDEVMLEIQVSAENQLSKCFLKDDLLFAGTVMRDLEVLTSSELVTLLLAGSLRKMSSTISVVNTELPFIFPCIVNK